MLGCGLDVDYPKENRELFVKVVKNGALISEYALRAQPAAWRFPLRKVSILGERSIHSIWRGYTGGGYL